MLRLMVFVLMTAPALAQSPTPDPYDQSKVPLEVRPPAGFQGKVVLVIAGKQSHGPGDHEFFAGSAILCNLLKQTPGVFPIMVRDGWPKDETLFEIADSIVMYMDGRGGHPVVQKDRLAKMDERLKAKPTGWVNLHYAVDYEPEHGKTVVNWMGGYYDKTVSWNPHWDAAIRSLPTHPSTRGVKPFTLTDEWYYNMKWLEDKKGVTPILQAVPPDTTRTKGTPEVKAALGKGQLETLAWAYERGNGGRGFGFTGGHFHRNWADEDFRRVVVNAILWSAKVDVPEGGAKVEFDAKDLNINLDKKKGEFKAILPPTKK